MARSANSLPPRKCSQAAGSHVPAPQGRTLARTILKPSEPSWVMLVTTARTSTPHDGPPASASLAGTTALGGAGPWTGAAAGAEATGWAGATAAGTAAEETRRGRGKRRGARGTAAAGPATALTEAGWLGPATPGGRGCPTPGSAGSGPTGRGASPSAC